jgi:CheY-like chemotaxis protein
MATLALISDLVIQSQVTAAARDAGSELVVVGSESALIAHAETQRPRLIIVDLSHPQLDPCRVMSSLQSCVGADVKTMAFGPHVHKELLAAAAAAGFGVVMSRGQFHAEMAEIFKRLGT